MVDQERAEGGLAPETHEVMALVERIKPMFADQEPEVVGAVLADLTALLIAGYGAENPVKTRTMRDQVLKIHTMAIKALVPLYEDMLKARMQKAQDDAKNRPN